MAGTVPGRVHSGHAGQAAYLAGPTAFQSSPLQSQKVPQKVASSHLRRGAGLPLRYSGHPTALRAPVASSLVFGRVPSLPGSPCALALTPTPGAEIHTPERAERSLPEQLFPNRRPGAGGEDSCVLPLGLRCGRGC